MLTVEATPEMLSEWRAVWRKYHDRLTPNRKSGAELVRYLSERYTLNETRDASALDAIRQNVLLNMPFAEKLPQGAEPSPVAYFVENKGAGAALYVSRPKLYADMPVFVGVDLASGMYQVEGSELLWDELCAYQGLDARDIENCFCVAQYIYALRRLDRLKEVIGEDKLL